MADPSFGNKTRAPLGIAVRKVVGFFRHAHSYVALMVFGIDGLTYWMTGVTVSHLLQGFGLIWMESTLLLSVTFFLGTVFEMQSPLAAANISPFSGASVPGPLMIVYAAVYIIVFLVVAMWRLTNRDL